MKNYYTIQADINTPLGIIRHCLSEDLHWHIATNSPFRFTDAWSASAFWKHHAIKIPLQATIHIRGPRGGFYRINLCKN